jgi:hypothetical protein
VERGVADGMNFPLMRDCPELGLVRALVTCVLKRAGVIAIERSGSNAAMLD